ncbi:NAD(P)/FAD-dependent oxidoreductase [Anabaena cylindrica FACHB-243]|uniref:Mercury(II) reductase n=1 Tax=Anabaena cylindrica (strain ATCC 27899 / PCC 7122) TaxID=272123 RepID=K9ZG18_ANACC|nr:MULTISPECIES: NAD(P)/FAD-dependent oxidoreductase [Anabaena]AFZ57532.1 Mercury(II) reductase [Anabaena cylindrica PCC 7122]MBD2418469.1 NAD(P)/FAD-dependent oxidoreductase [Anabaena cylindrica FACHB-243]MBY5283680.1 NAD(P)/FAD-dependent oxidoreductase [Anabaena sp. CCAP 1446/1C]MBY5308456.1 NAD(P)/FAD-dependent oxidoreductase [Anabaena sp. CCAP 1446/1C]MCM2405104.1 NAD(P)/FAD-dependent oxidoreductase [Anabaena sp. CCAP 1446/1C]
MNIDYDLVIIGGTIAGYKAALAATQLHAKVALIQPQINYELNYHYALSELGKAANLSILDSQVNTTPDIYSDGTNGTAVLARKLQLGMPQANHTQAYKETILYAHAIAANLTQINSLTNLAAQGVDVILGNGQFQSSPQLSFAINERLLRARTYLLACGSHPKIPNIEGLQTTGYLTLANIWQSLEKPNPPKNWVILGGLPQSIEIAQTLKRLGCRTTLILNHPYIFSLLDPEIAQLLIAKLESDGVRVLTETVVTQIRQIEDKKWIQAGDKAIETDEILVATGQQPNLEFLNLAAVGVKWNQHRLIVSQKLQTTNPRIFACGDVIGGYDIANIANYEANIALKNALFFPRNSVNYRCIPWVISSQPMVAQIGLTQVQAQRQYGQNQVLVFKQYFKTLTAAQFRGEITGICKLIVRENGEILGASILGEEAGELINLIALAMSQNIKVKHLANLAPFYPSFSEILIETAQQWSKQRLNKNHALEEFLQSFFHFRRDWNF